MAADTNKLLKAKLEEMKKKTAQAKIELAEAKKRRDLAKAQLEWLKKKEKSRRGK